MSKKLKRCISISLAAIMLICSLPSFSLTVSAENIATTEQMEVIRKIIYAVETGGQVYGNVRYDDFTEAYTNSSAEHAITIGGGAWYATEAQRLLKFIRSTDTATFNSLDTAGIGYDLDNCDWSTYKLSKGSAKAVCIQKIIGSNVGIRCQDQLIDDQMSAYMAEARSLGVTDIDAQMMCANFRHQGGLGALKRILGKTPQPYTLDNLYAACQTDTGNQVGAYKSRQKMVYESLKKYLPTVTETNPTAKALTFDANYYANKYADLKIAYGTNEAKLYEHFRNNGIKEGRQAHPCFNVQYYLNNYDDLKSAFGSDYTKAYEHYITTGYKEYHRVATAEPANLGAEFLANISFSSKNFSLSGDNVILYTPSSAPAQIWRFIRQSNGSYKIINTKNGKLLDAAAGTDNSGANIGICDGNETRAQRWFLYSKNGKYVLRPECARLTVADVTGASTSDLTNIQQYTYNGSDAQMFDIKKIDADAPKISNVTVSDVTFSGYKVTCTVTSAVSIKEVRFATWSKNNGQDDLVWSNGTISGDTVTYYVNTNEHNYEFGDYYTHIYAYDNAGKYSSTESGATVPESVLTVSNIAVSEVTPNGYKVTCAVNSNAGIKEVRFATWTENNDQDDLVWSTGTVNGNEITYYVDIKDHNSETGNYITHIYAYDKVENVAFEAAKVTIPDPTLEISDITISEITSDGYRVTCKVTAEKGIKEIKFATWTENNAQDDIIWSEGTLDGNTVTYYVSANDHNNEAGNYITHIYAFDNTDRSVSEEAKVTVPKPILEITDIVVSEITSEGYRVTCTVNSDKGIKEVKFPTWTESNGQDDIIWYDGTVNGNKATCYVNVKDHNNETGNYITDIYAYDNEGKFVYVTSSANVPEQATVVPPETKPEETKPEEIKPEEIKPEETKPEEIVLYGDINNDGVINVVDATLAQKYAADLINLFDDQIKRADVNFDGIVNVHDSTLIRKYAAEIILSFK